MAHVTTEWLQRARALFEQNPHLGMVGSQAGRVEGEVVQADAVRTPSGLYYVGEVAGGPVVIRRAALLSERVLTMARPRRVAPHFSLPALPTALRLSRPRPAPDTAR